MNSSELHLEVRTSYSSSYDHAIDQSCFFFRSSRQAVVPLCVRGVREHRGVHGVSGAPAGRMRGVRSRSLQGQATKTEQNCFNAWHNGSYLVDWWWPVELHTSGWWSESRFREEWNTCQIKSEWKARAIHTDSRLVTCKTPLWQNDGRKKNFFFVV